MTSSCRSCDIFLSHLPQVKLQRFPTDCAEIELNITADFLLSCFSFICVFIGPGHLGLLSQPAKNGVLYHRDSQCTSVSVISPIPGMTKSPGSYSFCNIFMLIMSGMNSLLGLQGHLLMGIHIPISAFAAMFMVNQKISNGLCTEEGEPTSQIAVLRVWHER